MGMIDFDDAMELDIPPVDVRGLLLETAVARARQEHEQLRAALHDMYAQVCVIRAGAGPGELNRELRKLRDIVRAFMHKWEAHVQWEENELFPHAVSYFGEEPDLFAYMEQEYELAEHYLRAFLQTLDRSIIPVPQEDAHRMTSYLLQAYAFLTNRFEEEDEIWTALVDRSNRLYD